MYIISNILVILTFPLSSMCLEYSYLLFENPGLTKGTFTEEQTIYYHAKNIRNILNLTFNVMDKSLMNNCEKGNHCSRKGEHSRLYHSYSSSRKIINVGKVSNHVVSPVY